MQSSGKGRAILRSSDLGPGRGVPRWLGSIPVSLRQPASITLPGVSLYFWCLFLECEHVSPSSFLPISSGDEKPSPCFGIW